MPLWGNILLNNFKQSFQVEKRKTNEIKGEKTICVCFPNLAVWLIPFCSKYFLHFFLCMSKHYYRKVIFLKQSICHLEQA